MKPSGTASTLAVLLLSACASGQSSRPVLTNGVVRYTTADGRRREVRIGKRCADLWVAPDESIIAFIAIEKAYPGTENGPDPFILESSLYTARKADGFRPVRVDLKPIVLNGRSWKIVRRPSVSPDLRTVYFSVPYTMKDWKLLKISLPSGTSKILDDHVWYCVIWGGRYSGDLLLLKNVYEPKNEGLCCFLRDRDGAQIRIDDPDCDDFIRFAARWSHERGGTCSEPGVGVDSEPPADDAPKRKRP